MPGVLPASPNRAVVAGCNLWLSRLPPSHRGAAPDQQAVEREQELSLPTTPPRSLSPPRVSGRHQKTIREAKWPRVVGRFCETPRLSDALGLASDAADALQFPSVA